MTDNGNWLSTSEAAKRLNVSPRTVRRRCERGEIGARLIGGVWEVDGDLIGHADRSADSRTSSDGHAVTDTRTVGQGADTDLNASADKAADTRTQSADRRTDGRGQSDTDARPGGQTDSDRLTARLLTQLETENSFLRATVEQLQRDGAETRAALRAALKLAGDASVPMLEAGTPGAPGAAQSATVNDVPAVTPDDGQQSAKRDGAALTYGDIADEIQRRINP